MVKNNVIGLLFQSLLIFFFNEGLSEAVHGAYKEGCICIFLSRGNS